MGCSLGGQKNPRDQREQSSMDLPSPITRTPSLSCLVMLLVLDSLKKPLSVSVSLPAPLSLSLSLYLCHWTGLPASQGKWNSPTFHIHSPSSCSLYHAPKHAINAYSKYHMVYYQQTLKLLKTLKITNFKTYKINQTTYKLIRIFILKKNQGIFKNLNQLSIKFAGPL